MASASLCKVKIIMPLQSGYRPCGQSGLLVGDWFRHTGECADDLAVVRSLWTVLPAAILWGASFPLALAAVASRGQDPARLVGGVYAANTVGAIVGSLVIATASLSAAAPVRFPTRVCSIQSLSWSIVNSVSSMSR